MSHDYRPLHIPECEPRKRTFWTLSTRNPHWENANKLIRSQLAARPPVPAEVWGPDLGRREIAYQVCGVFRRTIDWPNAHFIPEDSFLATIWADDLEDTEALMAVERLLGIKIDFEAVENLTLGEAIDAWMQAMPDKGASFACRAPVPLEVGSPLESSRCPFLKIFLDIRLFIGNPINRATKGRVRLDDRIRRQMSPCQLLDFNDFVIRRFGVDPCLYFHGGYPFTKGIVRITVVFLFLVLDGILLCMPFVYLLALLFVLVAPACILGAFTPYIFRKNFWRTRMQKRPRIRTFRELTQWILQERNAKLQTQMRDISSLHVSQAN